MRGSMTGTQLASTPSRPHSLAAPHVVVQMPHRHDCPAPQSSALSQAFNQFVFLFGSGSFDLLHATTHTSH